jgi:hypothetical protein
MKIKDIIKMLEVHDKDEEIFLMYWEKDDLTKMTNDEWKEVVVALGGYSFDVFSDVLFDAIGTELEHIRITNNKREVK